MSKIPKIVNVSGGRTSAYMAHLLKNKPHHYFIFQNTGREREETLDFLNRIDVEWGLNLVWMEYDIDENEKHIVKIIDFKTASRNSEPFEKLIDKRKKIPSIDQRFCTNELKTLTARKWILSQGFNEWHHLVGIRADEPKRLSNCGKWVGKNIRYMKKAPLAELGITKEDIGDFWRGNPLDLKLPLLPNGLTVGGNCKGCFFHSEYQKTMLCRNSPEDVDWLIQQEKKIGKTFHSHSSWEEIREFSSKTELFPDELEEQLYCQNKWGNCGD